jgi:carboxypeptidase D
VQLPTNGAGGDDEESIPLNSSIGNGNGHRLRGSDDDDDGDGDDGGSMRSRKGKEREIVFDAGSDNEYEAHRQRSS